jgi:signal transduction histidine kinase
MAGQGSKRALSLHVPGMAWLPFLGGVVATALIVLSGSIVGPDLDGPFLALAGLFVASALIRQTMLLHDLTRKEHEKARLVEDLELRIAELRRVQTEVIESARRAAVGELSAAVAHEVNNPLQVILGYAEILLYEAPPAGSPREELEMIRSEALRARSIVKSLRESARSQPPADLPTDPAELVPGRLEPDVPLDPVAAPEGLAALEAVPIAI